MYKRQRKIKRRINKTIYKKGNSWEIYIENRKEEEMRLKSRSLWLKDGDKNTTFFHNSMKLRRARNQIDKIQVDGQEVKGVEELKKEAHNHFKNLLTTNEETTDHDNFLQHTPKEDK